MQANTTTGIDAVTRHAIITERINSIKRRDSRTDVIPKVLRTLLDRGTKTAVEIASITSLSGGSVSSGINRAIKDGHIEYSGQKKRPRGAKKMCCIYRLVEPEIPTPQAQAPGPEAEAMVSPAPGESRDTGKALAAAEEALYAALELVIDARLALVKGGGR